MIQWLIELDRQLFLFLNAHFVHSILDEIMPVIRNRNTWFPLYALIIVVGIYKLKWRFIPWIVCLATAVAFADIISSHFVKPTFGRLRPCHELSPVYEDMILRLKRCSGHNSFTSSHAANHMAIASFIILASFRKNYWMLGLLLTWVFMICWGQIYVGVHYPLDIIGGLIIGFSTAFAAYKLNKFFTKKYKIFQNGHNSENTTRHPQ